MLVFIKNFIRAFVAKKISELLPALIPAHLHWKIKLFSHWPAIIGDMHDKVIIQEIQDSSLLLAVTHPAWAQELLYLGPILKKKINGYLENEYIKTIRFKIGIGNSAAKSLQNRRQKTRPLIVNKPLLAHEKIFLQKVIFWNFYKFYFNFLISYSIL